MCWLLGCGALAIFFGDTEETAGHVCVPVSMLLLPHHESMDMSDLLFSLHEEIGKHADNRFV